VPLAAVSQAPGGAAVFVVRDGRAHRRPIRLGVLGANEALVHAGLQEGESVVLAPRDLRDGQRVAVGGEGG
jgi:multidrug efflux pump subunit AcrA (membrane-fusion protein)